MVTVPPAAPLAVTSPVVLGLGSPFKGSPKAMLFAKLVRK